MVGLCSDEVEKCDLSPKSSKANAKPARWSTVFYGSIFILSRRPVVVQFEA